MPTPLAPRERPGGASPWAGERKDALRPARPFRSEATVSWKPAPLCVPVPIPMSRAEPLILGQELPPGRSTPALPRVIYRVSAGLSSSQPLLKEAQEGTRVRLEGSKSWGCSLLVGRTWEVVRPLCTSFTCNAGLMTVFTAWGG